MDETAKKGLGLVVHDLLLPGLQTDLSLVLATGPVLRKEADPLLRERRHLAAVLSGARPEDDLAAGHHRGHRGSDLVDDLGIVRAHHDPEAINPARMACEETVAEVLPQEIRVVSLRQALM
jgi:hypothetical protein